MRLRLNQRKRRGIFVIVRVRRCSLNGIGLGSSRCWTRETDYRLRQEEFGVDLGYTNKISATEADSDWGAESTYCQREGTHQQSKRLQRTLRKLSSVQLQPEQEMRETQLHAQLN
jgi:hypothetical protein